MAKVIETLDTSPKFFKGFNMGIIFNALSGSETDLGDLSTPKWVGNIFQGSTSWNGDAPEMTSHKDEKGQVQYILSSSGSYGVTLDLMSTADIIVTTFLGGTAVANSNLGSPTFVATASAATASAVAWGKTLPVINRPFALVNDTQDQLLLFPNATITATVVSNDQAMHVRLNVQGLALPETATYLDQVMICRFPLNLGDAA